MSHVWSEAKNVIAIFCSDLHLSLNPPIWRSAEPNWLEAQARPLEEIKLLQNKCECPVFCVGDIFDKWNCSPELINWTINHIPVIYAIPGQHDLPNHQYEDIHRSAYMTLMKADKIQNILPGGCRVIKDNMNIQGFPFGYEIEQCLQEDGIPDKLHIAIVHDYIWIKGFSYPNAPEAKKLKHGKHEKYFGYDIIMYGDNHQGFLTTRGKTTIFNCGTLMRRKSDEIDYRPQVGLLLESGEVIPHYLDISQDKYLDTMETEEESELDLKSFIEELERLGNVALDFKEAMKQFLHRGKTSNEAKQIILNAMEK